jgi:putative spermidine/putrescine transport system substrate-binding protein
MSITRRSLAAGAATLLLPATARAAEPPKPARIVLNDSGGAMANHLRRIFIEPFEARTGIKVVQTSPVDFAKLRAMVASGNVEWTVTEIGSQDSFRAVEMGLVEPIDPAIVDRSAYPEQARRPAVYASSVYSTVLAYDTNAFKPGAQPKGWAEFWDVKRFPGPRSLRNHPVDNLEFALLADGVPADRLYPLDVDRAFRKLDDIKPHVSVWWTTGAQPAQLLLDGEVVLATGWNGRFFELMQKKAPVGLEWTHAALKQGSFVIPKGAKDAYWGQQLLAAFTDPKGQARYAEALAYPGLNPASAQYIDPAVLPFMPTAPGNMEKQFWTDDAWWSANGGRAIERWNAWLLRK